MLPVTTMFKVKLEQVEALDHEAKATFPERLLSFLRRQVPEACGEEAAADVAQAITRAARWGLHGELEVATFAVLAFTHGVDFDEQGWARGTLALPDLTGAERIHRVYEAAIRRLLVANTALAEKETT